MSKQKKITVKFFLNKNVEPILGLGDELLYPVYLQVTYNRRNTQLRSGYMFMYPSLDKVPQDKLDFEQELIERIIRYEVNRLGDKFELKGLKDKYNQFSARTHRMMDDVLNQYLYTILVRTNSNFVYLLKFDTAYSTFSNMYEIALRLLPDEMKILASKEFPL